MPGKVGRNDPCPCGSGRKYKKCCQANFDEKDFHYRRWRRIEADLIPELLEYAIETQGPEGIEDAWSEFHNFAAPCAYDPELPMNMVFMPWFLFNWIPETERAGFLDDPDLTIASSFFGDYALSEDEIKFIMSANQAPYSLCEVQELTPGASMSLFDLLRGIKYDVIERTASRTLKKGEIIYCATTHLDGITSNIGTSPFALRPLAKRNVMELRKWLIDESGAAELTADHLVEFEADIRSFYLVTLAAMLAPPQLVNTDNEPLVPQKVHFEIESADSAFHALKGLAENIPEDELRSDANEADGLIVKAEIPWLGGTKEARKRLGGPVLLGTMNIEEGKLIISVNSTKRAETIRGLVEKRLGKQAVYKTTLIEPIDSEVEKMWAAVASGSPKPPAEEWLEGTKRTGVIPLADLPPEMRLKLEAHARQHWIAWFDLPVPALDNMTPREASKTEEGRELLESLLLDYERHNDAPGENLMRPDISKLRRELGMQV